MKFPITRSASVSMTGEKRGFSFVKVGKERKNEIWESEKSGSCDGTVDWEFSFSEVSRKDIFWVKVKVIQNAGV